MTSTMRFAAFATLLLIVPGTWAVSLFVGDAGLLSLLGFGVLFRVERSRPARSYPSVHG
jgi:hypothetical protein